MTTPPLKNVTPSEKQFLGKKIQGIEGTPHWTIVNHCFYQFSTLSSPTAFYQFLLRASQTPTWFPYYTPMRKPFSLGKDRHVIYFKIRIARKIGIVANIGWSTLSDDIFRTDALKSVIFSKILVHIELRKHQQKKFCHS